MRDLFCDNHYHVIVRDLFCANHYHVVLYCEEYVHPAGTAAVQEEEELRPMSSQSTGRPGTEM